MQIKSIVAGAAIALIAGVGSVSADELPGADTTGDTGTPFAMLDGIATEQLSVQELAETRGAADRMFLYGLSIKDDYNGSNGVLDPLWPTSLSFIGLK